MSEWSLLAMAYLVFGSPQSAPPQSLDAQRADLQKARSLYDDGLYAESIPLLDNILARTDLREQEKQNALFILGSSHLALGHDAAAKSRFLDLTRADSEFVLPPQTPRKVRAFYEQVRSEELNLPVIRALPPELRNLPTQESLVLKFAVERLGNRQAVMIWRKLGATATTEQALSLLPGGAASRPNGNATTLATSLIVPLGSELTIEYYAEVREGAQAVAHAGSLLEPLRYTSRSRIVERETSVYRKAWFWGVLGGAAAAVAGGSVAAYLLTRPAPAALSNQGTLTVTFGAGK